MIKQIYRVAILLLCSNIVILSHCQNISAPSEDYARKAYIATNSAIKQSLANLQSFVKTNGQFREEMGVKVYRMFYDAELYTLKKYWYKSLYQMDPGTTNKVSGYIEFEQTEKGWAIKDVEEAQSQLIPVPTESTTMLKIEVLNGTDIDGLARKFADFLKRQGFDPVTVTNFERRDIPRTMIIDRISNSSENGKRVAHTLGLSDDYLSYLSSPERIVAVSVIIGQDHKSISVLSE